MSVRLPDHLDLIAAAPDGIRKLRGLILELAVRGKLVPQDPNDEPASELLKRIVKERARLEASKRSQATPLGEGTQISFELPETWQWVRFEEIAQHNSGKTLDKGRNSGEPRAYITTSNLYWGRFELDSVRQMLINDDELQRCTARKNDLLICEGGEAGRAAVWPHDYEICFQNHVHRARLFGDINPYFAYRVFEKLNASGEINLYRKGVGISNMSGKALASIPFPLPPLAEQHRIVAKVDELMALCDRLEAEQTDAGAAHARLVATLLGTLTQSADAAELAANWQRLAEHFDTLFTTEASLDALKQTILQLAVMGKLVPQDPNDEPASELLKWIAKERARLEAEGMVKRSKTLPPLGEDEKPFEPSTGWVWVRFGSVVDLINGDRSKNYPNRDEYVPSGVPWINTGHIQPDGTLATDSMHFITREKFDSLGSGKIEASDLVYCLRGATFGKTAFVTPYTEGAIASSLVIVRTYLPNIRKFLFLYLTSPFGRSQIFRFDNGSAQPNLAGNSVTMYALALPPLAEQHRIVAKVDELLAVCDRLKADLADSRARLERLAATLIKSALQAA